MAGKVLLFPDNMMGNPSVKILRAAISSTAALVQSSIRKEGDWVSLQVFRKNGSTVFDSGAIKLADFHGFELPVPDKRKGYKVVYILKTYKNGDPTYYGRTPMPFYFERRQWKGGLQWFMIIGITSRDRLHTEHTARVRTIRSKFPRNRREWTPESPQRNRTQFQQIPTWNITNGSGSVTSSSRVSFVRSQSGTVTPGYQLRKKKGNLPVNAYSMSQTRTNDGGATIDTWRDDGLGSFQTQGGPCQDRWGTSFFGSGPASSTFSSNVDNRAIKGLQEKVGPSTNLAQDLAQIGQLTSLIGDTAIRIGASLRALRGGNFAAAATHLWHSKLPHFKDKQFPSPIKGLADNWLAYQYGWKPLLQDVREAMDAIARLQLASVVVYTHRSSAKAEDRVETFCHLGTTGTPQIGLCTTLNERIVRYGIRYMIENHLATFLAQTGFANPLNLAWEVIPYSFVFDWFLPVGNYLESLTAWNGLSFLDGYKVIVDKQVHITSASYNGKYFVTDPTDHQMIAINGSCMREVISYGRTKLSSFPTQTFPSFKSPLDKHAQHAMNALALLETHRKIDDVA